MRFCPRNGVVVAATAVIGLWAGLASGCGKTIEQPLPNSVQVVVRGHQEIAPLDPGSTPKDSPIIIPLFLGPTPAVGLCLQAPATMDTSQWEARLTLDGRPLAEEAAGPRAAMGPTVCFREEVPPSLLPKPGEMGRDAHLDGRLDGRLGGLLRDRFDGTVFQIPETPIRFLFDDSAYKALLSEAETTLGDVGGPGDPRQIVARIDALAQRAQQEGFPQLAVRLVLASTYPLRQLGTEESLAEVQQRLANLPPWLNHPPASGWATQVAFARASLALQNERLQEAWEHLRHTEKLQLRTANFNHLATVRLQAGILARVGTPREAILRLRASLEECERWPCNERLLPDLRSSLAWLTALDPLTDQEDLGRAEEALHLVRQGGSIEADQEASVVEQANHLLNGAALDARQGRSPQLLLTEARNLLASVPATDRERQLEGWGDVLEAQWHLDEGRPAKALKLCRGSASLGEVAAWAKGCEGRALRLLGDRQGAERAFDQALLLHETAAPELLGQSIPLGPGRRAEDYYAAARVQVELGSPASAWELLALLDQVSADLGAEGCEETDDQGADTHQRDLLLEELRALEGPASGIRRRQRQPVQRSLRDRLQELWRTQRKCAPGRQPQQPTNAPGPHLRAFAMPDEIILLQRLPQGEIRVARRTPMDRGDVARRLAQVTTLMEERSSQDEHGEEHWDEHLGPIARSLLPPDPSTLPAITSFALYGVLQTVPLASLPLPSEDFPPRRLVEITVPVVRPATTAPDSHALQAQGTDRPVFVVDPRQDLDGGALATFYRDLFPDSEILAGKAATGEAFFRSLETAAWLHVDAHGNSDAAFPELSSLLLADRPVTFLELADLHRPLLLANLSGCQTGRWPVTADSGRYGIGGLLAARGARWVVASRADLDNSMAADFNRAFYQRLASGDSVPEAYGGALRQLKDHHPTSAWAAFLLLHSDFLLISETGGQNPDELTPFKLGARSSSHAPPGEPDRATTDTGGRQ